MSRIPVHLRFVLASLLCAVLAGCGGGKRLADDPTVLRVGHFPNLTHAQALIAQEMAVEGRNWYAERLGPGVRLEWFVYNAGPSAIEAIFAKSIDLTYVGPSPLLNGYSRARGKEIRVVSGAALGGGALVVAKDGPIQKPADFRGGRIVTPQMGNTQDVAARAWLTRQGFRVTQLGGDVQVVPAANPDQLALFQQRKVEGAWTVEPWVSRLELEGGGRILVEEKEAVTTVLASSMVALERKPELVAKFVRGHEALTQWVQENPGEAKRLVRAALKRMTRREIPEALVERAWPRLQFTTEIPEGAFRKMVEDAQSVGFLKEMPPLEQLRAGVP